MIPAIVPCGGRSTRMGRPKLLLPIEGKPLIARVVRALLDGGASRVIVVAPPPVVEGAAQLVELASAAGAEVVRASAPTPDMRASVELGLSELAKGGPPRGILLAPGDSPGLSASIVRAVLDTWRAKPDRIVVPGLGGRGGHPVALPWELAAGIPDLPAEVGVNALLAARPDRLLRLDLDDPGVLEDLDTPEQYQRWE